MSHQSFRYLAGCALMLQILSKSRFFEQVEHMKGDREDDEGSESRLMPMLQVVEVGDKLFGLEDALLSECCARALS